MDRITKNLTEAIDKDHKEMLKSLAESALEEGRIITKLSRSFMTLILSLVNYASALENYSLEFDKTWDDLMKKTEKAMKGIKETTEKLKDKDLYYIK